MVGTFRATTWRRWLPVHVGPLYWDHRRPFRTAVGISVGVFGRCVYVMRGTE